LETKRKRFGIRYWIRNFVNQNFNLLIVNLEMLSAVFREALRLKLTELNAFQDEIFYEYIGVLVENQHPFEVLVEKLAIFLGEKSYAFAQWLVLYIASVQQNIQELKKQQYQQHLIQQIQHEQIQQQQKQQITQFLLGTPNPTPIGEPSHQLKSVIGDVNIRRHNSDPPVRILKSAMEKANETPKFQSSYRKRSPERRRSNASRTASSSSNSTNFRNNRNVSSERSERPDRSVHLESSERFNPREERRSSLDYSDARFERKSTLNRSQNGEERRLSPDFKYPSTHDSQPRTGLRTPPKVVNAYGIVTRVLDDDEIVDDAIEQEENFQVIQEDYYDVENNMGEEFVEIVDDGLHENGKIQYSDQRIEENKNLKEVMRQNPIKIETHYRSNRPTKPAKVSKSSQTRVPEVFLDTDALKRSKVALCTFWPNCKKGSKCPYFHPTICANFPQCPFGQQCAFMHPLVPCKFGNECLNPQCNFVHPSDLAYATNLQNPMLPALTYGPPVRQKVEVCKFGVNCLRPNCFFNHDIPGTNIGARLSANRTVVNNFIPRIKCINGPTCQNPVCTFQHLERDPINSAWIRENK